MAIKLDYDKFFNLEQQKQTIEQPKNNENFKHFLKSANETLSLVNTTLNNLGIEPKILKEKLQEKLGMRKQEVYKPYIVKSQNTQPKKIEQPKKEQTKKMEFNIDKIIKMIDLVLKFTKREDMTVLELKEFLEENKTLLDSLFK